MVHNSFIIESIYDHKLLNVDNDFYIKKIKKSIVSGQFMRWETNHITPTKVMKDELYSKSRNISIALVFGSSLGSIANSLTRGEVGLEVISCLLKESLLFIVFHDHGAYQ
eukprot:NODE_385_length_9550_cov_0.159877.p6 type:complete len:110 gc:universal NODE_385_length_9550_cov_0.159877:8997-8668(-)